MRHRYMTLQARMDDASTPEPMSGCVLWTGPVDKNGYGFLSVNDRKTRAHRIAWELAFGPIPTGLWVLHHCDVPACVNATGGHLYLGTAAQNTADKIRRGRSNTKCGEEAGGTKISEAMAREVLRAEGTVPAIASRLGISKATVSDIVLRKTWKHLSGTPRRTVRKFLAPEAATQARVMYATGRFTLREVGEHFGVTGSNVWRIVRKPLSPAPRSLP